MFVGLTTSGLMDAFATPFGADMGTMPGIQLHATMADNLLSNRFIRPASARVRVASVIAAGLAIGCLAAFLPFTPAAMERCWRSAAGRGSRCRRSRAACGST